MEKYLIGEKRYAFSLAEGMVMLVVVSILMALAAPLIARKTTNDSKRLIYQGTTPHTVTAMGSHQNLGIGLMTPDAKLTVKSTNSDNSLIAKFQSIFTVKDDDINKQKSNAEKVIFQVSPKSGDSYINSEGYPNGFQVYADGNTNAGCFPDYNNAVEVGTLDNSKCSGAYQPCYYYKTTKNGYIISPRSLIVYTDKYKPFINASYTKELISFHPTTRPYKLTANLTTGEVTVNQERYVSRVIVPTPKDTEVVMIRECLSPSADRNSCVNNNYNVDMISDSKMRFVPCK